MKRVLAICCILLCLCGCRINDTSAQVIATTLSAYEFTSALCEGTDIRVSQLITEDISCLHDYTLQVSQMRAVENASLIVISGGGLEDFLDDILSTPDKVLDASAGTDLLCNADAHHHKGEHHHETDPHYWLSPELAMTMVQNICTGLTEKYPQFADTFSENRCAIEQKLLDLQSYGENTLKDLSTRNLVTFHDGFAYFAQAFDLHIFKAIEEESGAEASAAELIEIIDLIQENGINAIFTEENGSDSAASIIAKETGAQVYTLSMAMSCESYFDAMYHNINTVKEALE